MKKKLVFCIWLSAISYNVISQSTELARIDYTYIPQSNSNDTYSRIRLSANYPIQINKQKTYIIIGGQYRLNTLDILDEKTNVNYPKATHTYHTIGADIGYTFAMQNNWRFGTRIGVKVSSDFEKSELTKDDFRYVASVFFVKTYKDSLASTYSRLILGTQYISPSSINFPVPIINYYKKFHSHWSYSIGTPKSNIKYSINKKNTLQAYVGIDRFYSNLQNNVVFEDEEQKRIAKNISMLNIIGALGYEYYFTEHLLLYIYTGHTLSNRISLRDNRQRNIKNISDTNTFYFRSGIKFKI